MSDHLCVVEKKTKFSADCSRGTVVVECDLKAAGDGGFGESFTLLQSLAAKQLALAYAASRGMSSPSLNGMSSSPYPVNAEDTPLDAVKDADGEPLPSNHEKMQPAKYRIDVDVAGRAF